MPTGTKRKNTRLVSIDPSQLTAINRTSSTSTTSTRKEYKSKRSRPGSFESQFSSFQKSTTHSNSQDEKHDTQTQPPIPVTQSNGMLWSDKFSPSDPSQLAVHPKKLITIHAWLNDALNGASHTRKYRRLLVLGGPAGCGKSTIIHTLCKTAEQTRTSTPAVTTNSRPSKSSSKTAPAAPIEGIGYEILEWKNTGNESSVSKPQEFSLWLMRASAGPTLSFDDDEDEPVDASLPSTSHQLGRSEISRSKLPMVLLVDDLPNLSHGETGRIFTNAIRQHLNTPRLSTPPLVVIISDTSITPGSNGFEESLSGRSGGFSNGEDRGTNVHTLLPPDILNHPATCLVKLLPVNNTLMKKMLTRIVEINPPVASSSSSSKLGPKDIDMVVEASAGDIRAALNNLQLFSNLPSRKNESVVGKPKKNLLPSALSSRSIPFPSSLSLCILYSNGYGLSCCRQLLGSRDESSVIFHSLGKILYNKRWGDDAKEDAKDKRIRAPEPDPLPAFWSIYSRRQRKTDMDRLYSDLSVSVEQFIVYLHQNYPPFTDSIDEASFFLEYLSLSDSTIVLKDQTRYSQALTTGFYHFHIAARAILLGLPSPVTRRAQKFSKPALWGHLRQLNENAALADSTRDQHSLFSLLRSRKGTDPSQSHEGPLKHPPFAQTPSVLNAPRKVMALEVLPFLGMISSSLKHGVSDANDELIDRFSTYVFPNARDTQTEALLSDDDALDEAPEPEPGPSIDPLRSRPSDPSLDGLLGSGLVGQEMIQQELEEEETLWFEKTTISDFTKCGWVAC
ncbi:hypothetical protein PSHT_14657 [Puccinia striiformis]|uniref:AAA+ ATPase domain-containing protein n=1 Tax=Puccinia striiformis TaxID=27350 RepID=A0A2S4UJ72_9BASI|nr:hypothetical protein PSHT_14657 [Puccinia striiformis]